QGAYRGSGTDAQRRASDRARNDPCAPADPPGGRRYLGQHRLQASAAERVEGRQRTPDRRNLQAARDVAQRTLTRAKIPNPKSQAPNPNSVVVGVWVLGFGFWDLIMRRQHIVATVAALGGAALFAYAVRRAGVADILDSIRRIGWGLIVILALAGLRFLIRAE